MKPFEDFVVVDEALWPSQYRGGMPDRTGAGRYNTIAYTNEKIDNMFNTKAYDRQKGRINMGEADIQVRNVTKSETQLLVEGMIDAHYGPSRITSYPKNMVKITLQGEKTTRRGGIPNVEDYSRQEDTKIGKTLEKIIRYFDILQVAVVNDDMSLLNKIRDESPKQKAGVAQLKFLNTHIRSDADRAKTAEQFEMLKARAEGLLKAYKHDPSKQRGEYSMVITRHPYDIQGMSTDRNWTSCTQQPGPGIKYSRMHVSQVRTTKVPQVIKYGTLAIYFVHANDLEIKDPVARVLVMPYENKETGDIVYSASQTCYGGVNWTQDLDDTVMQWINDNINSLAAPATDPTYAGIKPELQDSGDQLKQQTNPPERTTVGRY